MSRCLSLPLLVAALASCAGSHLASDSPQPPMLPAEETQVAVLTPASSAEVQPAAVAPEPQPAAPLDKDGDGIPDEHDLCPEVPEDTDGFQDEDGCPDPDNDQDGVADVNDRCPGEPGPGSPDGCPAPTVGAAALLTIGQAVLTGKSIEVTAPIRYELGKATIRAESLPILRDVVAVMKAKPNLVVEVGVHSDDQGAEEYNKAMTQARAEAVVKQLMGDGIPRRRLRAVGHGSMKPLAPNTTEAGRTRNRRTEFVVARR
jgi:outer membrane protein OmpA-like peptidoglycan-associated protein